MRDYHYDLEEGKIGKSPRESVSPTHNAAVDLQKLIRRDTIELNTTVRDYRRLKLRIYNFLDHPRHSNSVPYHTAIFCVVLISVVLGAGASKQKTQRYGILEHVHYYLEFGLAIFFLLEFIVRMWAVAADAKYNGFKGRARYLIRLVGITDITIITVSFAMIIVGEGGMSENTKDYLRFVQILRLFHIDRQMTTWRLIKDMVILSKTELATTYYITFFVILCMANMVYYSEGYGQDLIDAPYNQTSEDATFPTLAHAWWFTIVSILTIGYGDIVPTFWMSKVVVCVLGFIAYCTFVAASTQISVGLTLMMEEDTKNECKNKMRNSAASVIQCWLRYHLATKWPIRQDRKDGNWKTAYFKHICYKIYLTEERINRDREITRRLKEKLEKRKHIPKVRRFSHQHTGTTEGWMNIMRQQSIEMTQNVIQPAHLEPGLVRKLSNVQLVLPSPVQGLKRNGSCPNNLVHLGAGDRRKSCLSNTDSHESGSIDLDELEATMAINNLEKIADEDVDISEIDDTLLFKYRPLLRFFNFLLFHQNVGKFQRLRKADHMLEMDTELRENEYVRDEKLKELELRLGVVIGKATSSSLEATGEKRCITERLTLCEERMRDMDGKIEEIQTMMMRMLHLMGAGRAGRRLSRQKTIDEQNKEEDTEEG